MYEVEAAGSGATARGAAEKEKEAEPIDEAMEEWEADEAEDRSWQEQAAEEAEAETLVAEPAAGEQDPQYVEDMEDALRTCVEASLATRVFARWREAETGHGMLAADGKTRVVLEQREAEHVSASLTRRVLTLVLRLHLGRVRAQRLGQRARASGFDAVVAVDGSYRPPPDEPDGPTEATAWGSYDGRTFRGGALPPSSGSYVAELMAVERTLARQAPGDAVLLLSDCQGAMRAIEAVLEDESDLQVAHDARPALRRRSAGTALEAIREHVRRIASQGAGEVVFLYTPAHTGGISANAYADAAAKAHLGAEATEPELEVASRLCVFSRYDALAGREWRLSADKPQYRLMHALAMARQRVAPEGQLSVAERLGVDRPWHTCMKQRPLDARAGGPSGLSGIGRRLAAQYGRFGSFIGDSGAECELCGGVADVLHMVSGECSCVPASTRSRHCEGAAAALLHAAAALPTPPAEGPDDSKGGRAPRPRKAGPAAAPAGDGWFRFSSAHSGQCRSDRLLQVEPGSTEDAYLTPWLALAIARARQTAEAEGAVMSDSARRVLGEVSVEMRNGRPYHTGGIRAVHVAFGQLRSTEGPTPAWAAELLRAARADGEGGYVRCEQKAEGGRVEAAAFTPDDEHMRVESAYAWPRLVRYVVVLEYDELRDVAILIKQETRRRTAREEPRRYAGTPPEHADADVWCTALHVSEPYDAREAVDAEGYDLQEGVPLHHYACSSGYDERTRLHRPRQGFRSRLLDTSIAFVYQPEGGVLVKPVMEEACDAHAAGAVVDVGRRSLFETGRWPGAPEYEEPMHEQLRVAADAFSTNTGLLSREGADGELRKLMSRAVAAAAGGVVETPSAGALRHAKTLQGRALQEARARQLAMPPEERLRIAVAGSRSADGDPGPGKDVMSVDATRSGGSDYLGNPFPMGDRGVDEKRRGLVLDLHKRWLRAWDVPAADMRCADDSPLPADVRPTAEAAARTGGTTVRLLAALVASALREQVATVRLECASACRAGCRCHCENLAELMRLQKQSWEARGAFSLRETAAAAEPTGTAAKVARRLEALQTHVWKLIGAREGIRRRAAELVAAQEGMTVAERRVSESRKRKAAAQAERDERVEATTAEVRAEGGRQRGAPREAAAKAAEAMAEVALTAEEAVEHAEGGAEAALTDGWTVSVPLALLSEGGRHSARRVAACFVGVCLSGAGMWVRPCSVRLEGGARWVPPQTLLRWSDLRGQRRHGSRQLACALVGVEAAEVSSEDEEGEERLQQARELAAAKRRLTQQRQASRTQAQRRLKAAARRLALEAAGGSGDESSEVSEAEAGEEEAAAAAGDGEAGASGGRAQEGEAGTAGGTQRNARHVKPSVADTYMGEEARRRLLRAAGGTQPAVPPRPPAEASLPPLDTSLGAKQLRLGAPRAAAPAPPLPPPPPASEAAPAMETAIERALRCGARGNLWGVLGLQRGVSVEAARGALRAVRVATHPDRNRGSAATEAAATEAAKWVARAAEVLTNPEKRGAYVNARHSLAEYEEAMAGAAEAETRKRQRAEDEKAEREKKEKRRKAAVGERTERWEEVKQGASGERSEMRETTRSEATREARAGADKARSKRKRQEAKARGREAAEAAGSGAAAGEQ